MKIEEDENLKHIAIIMDGNRRWAKEKGLPVALGHKEGAKTLEKIVKYANKIGLKYITVYAFSTENWKRAEEEVKSLMLILQNYIDSFAKTADLENIKIEFLGDVTVLNPKMQKGIQNCIERTKNNTGVHFNIALNYGGRLELVKAMKEIALDIQNHKLKIEDINENTIESKLYTANQPEPDLVIRTSNEMRTSNFLPWQITYSELLFVEKYWPDFSEEDLDNAILEYRKRNRRKGK